MPIKGRECAKACKRWCGIVVELYKVWPEQEGGRLVRAKFDKWTGANHEGLGVLSYKIWILRVIESCKNFKQESDMIRLFIIEKPLFYDGIEDRLGKSSR